MYTQLLLNVFYSVLTIFHQTFSTPFELQHTCRVLSRPEWKVVASHLTELQKAVAADSLEGTLASPQLDSKSPDRPTRAKTRLKQRAEAAMGRRTLYDRAAKRSGVQPCVLSGTHSLTRISNQHCSPTCVMTFIPTCAAR